MMARTVFRTPVFTAFLRGISRLCLYLTGWRVVGTPPPLTKYVLIGAPHTSNWDFPLMLMAILVLRMEVRWMGKNSLFRRPFGGLMRWLGGLPIDRSRSSNTVSQMVETYREASTLVVLIPPEGTRSKVERWRTGFYHIACGADVPILLGFLDGSRRQLGFGPLFYPSGDFDADMEQMLAFYRDKHGIRPENG